MKILIIEDDSDLREMFKGLFEEKGHVVYLAENGKMGLELLENEKVDLVLTDVQMPVMTGMDFLVTVQSIKRQPPPIVVMTGGSPYTIKQFFDAGAAAYFDKLSLSVDAVINVSKKVA